ncbi:MAG: hypothetical protein VYD19_05915 [Myxococcota bacterium]|nr:hypothetical protein [Myxococcota bacterium]
MESNTEAKSAQATEVSSPREHESTISLAVFILLVGLGGLGRSLGSIEISWRDILTMATGSALTIDFALRRKGSEALFSAALTGVAFAWYYLSFSPNVFFFVSLTVVGLWLLLRGLGRRTSA